MGPLPFNTVATVKAQGGATTREGLPCSSAWPAGSGAGRVGVQHDHIAQAALIGRPELQATNAKIEIDGVTFSIIGAEPHEFLPHVDLRLRVVKGG